MREQIDIREGTTGADMGFFEGQEEKCGRCGLSASCTTAELPHIGKGGKRILILVDAPTEAEDTAGRLQFGGTDNLYLQLLRKNGIDPEQDCWKACAVKCWPGKGKTPKVKEIRACSERLRLLLQKLHPVKVFVLGKIALEGLIGNRISVGAVSKWVGHSIPDREYHTKIYPLYSPGYVYANTKQISAAEPLYRLFCQQVEAAVLDDGKYQAPVFENYSDDPQDLHEIRSGVWAVDFETTGLKPHAEGHAVVCVAFSNGQRTVCVPVNDETLPEVQRILTAPEIKLVAHNLKFEDTWARHCLGVEIETWFWDTMLAAHCIDNRGGTAGLKFQAYVNFGVAAYEKEMAEYIDSEEKNANAMNRIAETPWPQLARYCAEDAFYTYHLCSRQYTRVPPGFLLLMDGAKELSRVEANGFCMDVSRIQKQRERLRENIIDWRHELQNHRDVQRWAAENSKEFNPNSTPQLTSFFRGVGEKLWKRTEKDNDSTDKEVLESFRHPVAKLILKIRAAEKLEGTFLSGLETEQVDGMLRPFYSLGVATTYRSSSQSPNFQNFPKRDPVAQRIIRGNFRPRPGRQLLEVDYSGIEVRVAACYNKDLQMIRYVTDPTTDMHRDVAALIFKIKPEEVTKEMRQVAKGGFVFPAFYGSWYKQMAESMWRDATADMRKTLAAHGIKTPLQFERHLQIIEEHFWGVRFTKYADWKKRQWQEYQQELQIGSHTGFRYTALMNRKDVSNYPIQGSAFHCLLWSLIQMSRWLRRRKMETVIVGQIHDSILLDVVPAELALVKRKLRRVMCEDIRKEWPWIVVPLDIDAEISAVDGRWSEMQPEEI